MDKRIIGSKYSKLTILEDLPLVRRNGHTYHYVKCLCDCGNIKTINLSHLKNGGVKSCGCLLQKIGSDNVLYKHGLCSHPLYKLWSRIIARCYYKTNNRYCEYGGRGIKIWDGWKNNPQAFIDYIESLPKGEGKNLTIDRIDNNGNYEPNNIRWSPKSVQSTNKRKPITNTSGYVGVRFRKDRGTWFASVSMDYRLIYIGSSPILEDAVKLRDQYIIDHNLESRGYKLQYEDAINELWKSVMK